MTAGQMRDRVTFQAKTETPADGVGQPASTWVDGDTVWGRYEPASGQEIEVGNQVRMVVSGKVTILRYDGLTSKMRLKLNGWGVTNRVLNIAAVMRPETDGSQTLLVAEPEAGQVE